MALIRKQSIQTLIDTNLASGKTPKISPADHVPVAKGIINYIDNRILTRPDGLIFAGTSDTWTLGSHDYQKTILFNTSVDITDYVVIGCLISTTRGDTNCRYFWQARDKTTTQFTLNLFARYPQPCSLSFEYILFSPDEIQ